MRKIGIFCDGCQLVHPDLIESGQIVVSGDNVIIDGVTYYDYQEGFTTQEYIDMVEKADNPPSTAGTSPALVNQLFEGMAEKYDTIYAYPIPPNVSSVNDYVEMTANDFQEEVEDITIYVEKDSIIGGAGGFILEEALRLAEAGKSLEEIKEAEKKYRKEIKNYVALGGTEFTKKGGRMAHQKEELEKTADNERVVIDVQKALNVYKKFDNEEDLIADLMGMFDEDYQKAKEKGSNLKARVITSAHLETEQIIIDRIQADYPDVEFDTFEATPSITTHLGIGSFHFTWAEVQTD